ncbi:unnamed protein product [Caenorhabditis angaria]|uniref:C6 domain-containing protein n=1 Tax=Caenorhabditis angaria TaxID=860376 RepID=A0A9P1NCD4_9PELO|nr:unnamed protein product [Caenorhabditis angaria]
MFFIFVLILTINVAIINAAGCQNISTPANSNPASIQYSQGVLRQADITCDDKNGATFELISDRGSLGVATKKAKRAICRLGRWYTLNKNADMMVFKEVECVSRGSIWG